MKVMMFMLTTRKTSRQSQCTR